MYLDFGGIYRLKNFIHMRDFSKEEINHIFELADKIKAQEESTSLLYRFNSFRCKG